MLSGKDNWNGWVHRGYLYHINVLLFLKVIVWYKRKSPLFWAAFPLYFSLYKLGPLPPVPTLSDVKKELNPQICS